MSTNNRIGRNPFDKKSKTSKVKKPSKVSEALQTELHLETSSESILKVSDKKTEENKKAEEKIIGELIDLPEENWQPLSMVPAQFIKQLFSRWL